MAVSLTLFASDANWDGTLTLIGSASEKVLFSLRVHNENASTRYLQVFNAAATADVTLGTTEPTINVPIATDTLYRDVFQGMRLSNGIVIALTTTSRGATAGGTGNYCIEYA